MENLVGLLKIRVIKGTNLVVKDSNSSDPYVIGTMGSQGNESKKNKRSLDGQHGVHWVKMGSSIVWSKKFIKMTLKTRHVKNDCNPVWNDQLTLAVYDPDVPINLTVYDKDTFTPDDKMGNAGIDIKPYLKCLKAGLRDLPTGTVVDKIHPNRKNLLADVSQIVWKDGKLVQDMILRLNNVATGEVEIQIEWANVGGSKGLNS